MLAGSAVRGFILDITGVLYNGSPGTLGVAIPGSIEAVNRIYRHSKVRFLTNESTLNRAALANKLKKLGFQLNEEHIIIPIDFAKNYLRKNNLKPHVLVHKDVESEFIDVDQRNPNCILIGDAEEGFTYEALNKVFRILIEMKDPLIISMGYGKFYRGDDGLKIDVGCFVEALKFASNASVRIIGKPQEEFYLEAINDMGLCKNEVVMIGDDINSDIGGAKNAGLRSILVRTGKWRSEFEEHEIKPNLIVDNLLSAVNLILPDEKKAGNIL